LKNHTSLYPTLPVAASTALICPTLPYTAQPQVAQPQQTETALLNLTKRDLTPPYGTAQTQR